MTKAGNLTKGSYIHWRNEPYVVVKRKLTHMGRGTAKAKLRLKALKSGHVVNQVFNTDEQLDEIHVSHQSSQYLYRQGKEYIFMDTFSYEQFPVSREIIGEKEDYLVEGETYQLVTYKDGVIELKLPPKITLEITNTSKGVKGVTVSGATKPATLETGLKIKVPLFVKQGEKVIVNTESGEYVERA
jgi:elongation factor P